MNVSNSELARLMRLCMFAIYYAVDNAEMGRLDEEQRNELASTLDKLSYTLRGEERPVIIPSKSEESP